MDRRSCSPSVPGRHTNVCPRCCIASRSIWRVRLCLRYHVEALRRIHEPNGHDTSTSLELIWTPIGPQISQPERALTPRKGVPAMLHRLEAHMVCASVSEVPRRSPPTNTRAQWSRYGHVTRADLKALWTADLAARACLDDTRMCARDVASPPGPYGVCVCV